MDFTQEQIKAIKSLEDAFKKCKDAGLHFAGIDNALMATTGDTTWEAMIMGQEGIPVETHGTYGDSFGA